MVRVTHLLRVFLTISAGGFILGGLALLLLPDRDTVSPALDVVFRVARRSGADPRDLWGAAFLLVGVIAAAGAWRQQLERPALLTVLGAETGWALGLTAPLVLNRTANALAVVAWLMLAVTSAVVVSYSRHR